MGDQPWYSRWEKQPGLIEENSDLVAVVDKESKNSMSPIAYQRFFRQIKVFMERSQQRRPSGIISTPPDTTDTEKDYLYQDYATILQANYGELEEVYKKQYMACSEAQEKLTEQLSINFRLEQTIKDLQQDQLHFQDEQAARHLRTSEFMGRVNDLEARNAELEEELQKERQRHKEKEETMLQRLSEQIKNKEVGIMNMAKQRQQMEVQMMEAHKELLTTQAELAQRKTDILQLSQLVLATSTQPNAARSLFTKYVSDVLSTHALQAMLQSGNSNYPQQGQHQQIFQQSMQHIQRVLNQQQQQQRQILQQQQQQQQQQLIQQTVQQQQYQQFQGNANLPASSSASSPTMYSNNNPSASSSPTGMHQGSNQYLPN